MKPLFCWQIPLQNQVNLKHTKNPCHTTFSDDEQAYYQAEIPPDSFQTSRLIIKVSKIKNLYQAQLYISVPPASTVNNVKENPITFNLDILLLEQM